MDTLTHQLIVLFPDHTLWVDADPLRLTQVISNLLNNAVKYTPPGGRIECTVRDVDGHAVLSVSDTGVGITVEMLPRIFDLFAQADGARTRGRDGLGIGLTLVRRLVQLHGGQVEGRSDGLGRGSEFIVRLPLTQPLCEVPLNAASLPNRALATRKIGYACAPRRPFEIA
jgi:signal transduction histidine kinase